MTKSKSRKAVDRIGLVGLGLMGRGIATCLLAHGFEVVGYNRTASRARQSVAHVEKALDELVRKKIMPRARLKGWRERFVLVKSLAELGQCSLVIESVAEDLALKRSIFRELEAAASPEMVIATNSSSFPITLLQAKAAHPERFIGMHWGEPAEIMRYLEIIPSDKTSQRTIRFTEEIGKRCGKEPTVLHFDIRGFLSNRMMYAMLREAFYLVESGVADVATVDRSFRNDIGWWATLAGPFRWMDLTGIPAYAAVMEGLLPELSEQKTVPKLMRQVVKSGAQGISNVKGFYPYSRKTAQAWQKAWVDFTYDIRKLVEKYEQRVKL
ncbi:MAG TPA: 3-hydroxyacyl-CoA dehydrogenase family protein [Bryobacteraceae bacterium]|nr:3-hydroxyacyl-CoA dehydrogenase family protein [Bryobacteraceae bacterium]